MIGKNTKRNFLRGALLLGFALAPAVPTAHADTTLVFGQMQEDKKTISAQRIRIKGDRLALDGGTDEPYMIFYGGYDRAYVIDHEEKSYLSLDPEKVTKIVEEMSASRLQALADMEKRLAAVPEEEKPQMQKMVEKLREATAEMEDAPERVVEFKTTGETVSLGGRDSEVVEAYVAGKLSSTYYLVNRAELKISDADYAVMQKFEKFLRMVQTRLPPSLRSHFGHLEALAAPDGTIPLKVESAEGRPEVLIEVSDETIPAKTMNVPVSYRPQDVKNDTLQ